jgi:site-specific DNA-cytosine methylase
MLRVIREAGPTWIVGENVAGIVNMALDQVHIDLEAEDYEVESIIVPACGVDAPHRRNRVWIVANSKSGGGEEGYETRSARKGHKVAISYLETRVDYLENYAPKMWPTPRASEYKDTGPVGSKSHSHMNARDYLCAKAKDPSKPSGCLSPMWTEWLMGYPIGWGELEDSATPSSRKSRQKSSDASSR